MRYSYDIQDLLDKIEVIVSKEYDETIDKLTKEYDTEISRLNAVIEAWKDICGVSQNNEERLEKKVKEILAENEKLKEINGKLSDRLSWRLSDEPCYRVK